MLKYCTVIVLACLSLCEPSSADFMSSLSNLLRFERHPARPSYPKSYEVSYNFTLPYERDYLPDGLSFPVRVWRDEDTQKIRMDTYNGVNTLITDKELNLEVFPRIDEMHCAKYAVDPGQFGLLETPIFPDITEWDYIGRTTIRGVRAFAWEYSKRHGDKHTKYKFYADEDGKPLRLHMHGNDAFSGAHFDLWVADYYDYRPGTPDSSVFEPPKICKDVKPTPDEGLRSFPAQMRALAPTVHTGMETSLYSRFIGSGVHSSSVEQQVREAALRGNAAYVQSHNSDPSLTSKLELNRFADWTQEEFEAVMLPRHRHKRGLVAGRNGKGPGVLPYERLAPKGTIPGMVDWRGSAAETVVKDQAACGSCWAFGATGTLEAAHYLATGKKALFSEQQLMDCSWGHGLNKACDGGDYDAAMDYLKLAGGPLPEERYEYLGADGFCRQKNFTSGGLASFQGYAYVPSGDDEALMEAVYSRGPIAVSLDASQPAFRFYSGGVLDEPKCMWKSDDLDHAVLLVGYGTCQQTGKDYWLIKNSWSTHWGDKGYIKIARAHHGCGISTDPVYAVFKSEL